MSRELEYHARLANLRRGPWREKGDRARQYLLPPERVTGLTEDTALIDLQELAKQDEQRDPDRNRSIRQTLRWHGNGADVTLRDEIAVRDSLDYALAHLMILELAVEMGYLPLELIRTEAHRELLSLLWSAGAQQFVRHYDYVTIEYLARRLEVRGFRNMEPPPVNPEASTRFAVFLAQFSDWVEDNALREWLMFLDDYVEHPEEQAAFRSFLNGNLPERSERFERLLYGIRRFLLSLSNLFGILAPAERARCGLFYSYWMAKFFGYELKKEGYRKATQESWAILIGMKAIPSASSVDQLTLQKMREVLDNQIGTIQETWDATRELVAAATANRN